MDSAGQDINLNSPNKGMLSDFMTDVPVDQGGAARTPAVEGLTEAEEEELRAELVKLQEDPGNPLTGWTEDICCLVHCKLCYQQKAWRHEELCNLQVI
ncbi:tumor protein D54 isoform X5 [Perognathus longimembris pacificus]|uniref:tumor protein D54 isoform X5 n=1 Tax=Perognathus longimembris pacificus TaxID=214514 RepID=UPI0020186ADA|nr:tumor protein D54 isoform X5 [Perognathus longimembris pacificus]